MHKNFHNIPKLKKTQMPINRKDNLCYSYTKHDYIAKETNAL